MRSKLLQDRSWQYYVPSPFVRDTKLSQSREISRSMQKGEHGDTAYRRVQAEGEREPQGAGILSDCYSPTAWTLCKNVPVAGTGCTTNVLKLNT